MTCFIKIIKKVFFCLIIFLSNIHNLSAQDSVSSYKNHITLSPFRVIDLMNPGIELSYERNHSLRYSTQLSFALMTDPVKLMPYTDFSGYRIALEEKYFLKHIESYSTYTSAELIYYKITFEDVAQFGYAYPWENPGAAINNYPDTFTVHKQTFTFNLKCGIQMRKGRFIFDACAGLGIKYKDIQHSDRLVPEDDMEKPRHPNVYYSAAVAGKHWTINIPVNMKIGYSF
jgi:hypothetical protein